MSGVWCAVCGGVIGVYEPVVVLGDGSARSSSLAREPALGSGSEVLAHDACGAEIRVGAADRWSLPARRGGPAELG